MSNGSVWVAVEPDECVGVCQMNARVVKRMLVQLAERRNGVRDACHVRVEIDDLDELDRLIFFDLAKCQAIAAAEHQHAFWRP